MAFNNSVILQNDNGTSLTLQFEEGLSKDQVVELPLTDERIITEKKFRKIIEDLKNYLADPIDEKLFLRPVINSYKNVGNELILNLDDFVSPVFMRLAGILIRINNNYDIIPPENFLQDLHVNLSTSFIGGNPLNYGLTDGATYVLGLRFLTDGRYSDETVTNYVYTLPITNKPVISRVDVNDFDLNTGRCLITAYSNLSVPSSFTHLSTDWVIEKMSGDDYAKVWVSENDTVNKETLNIGDLVMNSLDTDTIYYLSCRRNYNSDRSSQYSDRFEFKTPKLVLDSVKDFKKYPNYVSISNPELSIASSYSISNSFTSRKLLPNEITSVVWRLYDNQGIISTYTGNGVFNWKLIENTLSKNTTYTVEVFYVTTMFGNSPISTFKLETKDFDGEMDGLPNIISKYDEWCYFGEIEHNNLMVDGIKYRGVYDSNKNYYKLDEVSYNGILYICIANTPNIEYSFSSYFKTVKSDAGAGLYKSGLPTAKQLLEYLGLEENLGNVDTNSQPVSLINSDTGYVKLQLPNGNIGYLTKKPIFTNFTVNDLIRCNLFHPYHRTIRIGKHLYYPRLLIRNHESPYDPIMSDFANRDFNDTYRPNKTVNNLGEEQLIPMLLNGRLAYFNIPSIGIDNINYSEVLYDSDKPRLMKIETTSSYYDILSIPLDNVDKTDISIRIMLERINEEDYPMDHISELIVGNNKISEGNYDRFTDTAYLGYVQDTEFLNTESIFNRIGLTVGTPVNNIGWFKFYYQGLIYFFSDGINIKDVNYNTLRTYNLTQLHPLLTNNKGTLSNNKLGKVNHNNLIYNVSLPSVVNYNRMFSTRMIDTVTYDIFNNTDPNIDLKIADNCMFSNCLYPILRNKTPEEYINGFKGSWPYNDFGSLINGVGGSERDKTFLSRNELKDGNIITNNETDLFKISKQLVNEPGRAILCLTIPAKL